VVLESGNGCRVFECERYGKSPDMSGCLPCAHLEHRRLSHEILIFPLRSVDPQVWAAPYAEGAQVVSFFISSAAAPTTMAGYQVKFKTLKY
jgi:hypothetical protein